MLDLNNKVNNGGTTAAGQLDADEWNQLPSEVQSAIESAGITLSGGDLTQLVTSVAHYSSVGQFFTGGGIADAYTAAIIAPRIAPPSLINGMELNLIIPATSTGASTLNAFGTGAVAVKLDGGVSDPVAGDMVSGKLTRFKYLTTPSAHWEILNPIASRVATQTETDAGLNDSKVVTPLKMRFGFSILLANTGYIVFPSWMGGPIIQWSLSSMVTSPHVFTLPLTYPAAQRWAIAGERNVVDQIVGVTDLTTTTLTLKTASGSNAGATSWLSIGH